MKAIAALILCWPRNKIKRIYHFQIIDLCLHLRKLFLLLLVIFSVFTSTAQRATSNPRAPYYTLDHLPSRWLRKPKVLQTIDALLPITIAQLKDSRSCLNCGAAYAISIKIDTVYILY